MLRATSPHPSTMGCALAAWLCLAGGLALGECQTSSGKAGGLEFASNLVPRISDFFTPLMRPRFAFPPMESGAGEAQLG